jgi:acyl-coenzyme A thioesterase PaaI-like protein
VDAPLDPAAATAHEGELVHNLYVDPDLPAQIVASRRVAAAARRVIASTTGPAMDATTLDEVAVDLEGLADRLAPFEHESRWPGGTASDVAAMDDQLAFEWHPLIGPSNAIAAPMRIVRDGERAVGTITFNQAYEGPRGFAHGGFIAAMFDVMLLSAATLSQVAGLTGTLSVRYRRPTPLHRPIRYEAWIDEVLERKAIVKGASSVDGEVLAEAEGIFICVAR